MATVRLWRDDEVGKDPAVKAVFDDIRRVRGSDFVCRSIANSWSISDGWRASCHACITTRL
jgi:hypothetical protein